LLIELLKLIIKIIIIEKLTKIKKKKLFYTIESIKKFWIIFKRGEKKNKKKNKK
jgi:hypothetical protein